MVRCAQGGHASILKATDDIIRQAATALYGAPVSNPQTDFDIQLYNHMRDRVILWNSDAAGDEQLAGRESRIWTPRADDVRPLFPNLVFVHRDKAHAGRRVLRRPWYADEVLKGVHTSCVAMFSVIQYSSAVKAWYQDAQQEMQGELKVQKDLAWCEIRFDSAALPLAKLVMTFGAVVATATRQLAERKSGSSGSEAIGSTHIPIN